MGDEKKPEQRRKPCRDRAIVALSRVVDMGMPDDFGEAVDAIVHAAVEELNSNLRSEIDQVRRMLGAHPHETTYRATKRMVSERNGLAAKYQDAHEKTRVELDERLAEIARLRALCHDAVDSWADAAPHYPALRLHHEHQEATIAAFKAKIGGAS